jgi:glycosyltransferase involved in cell wall biosynthesis
MVAKGMYVDSRSGWFSERSICYLACGRPVLAQDTGLAELYPAGSGLITFSTLEEAVAGVESIVGDYDRHSRAARAIAEEYFDSDKVLTRLVERVLAVAA